MKRTIDVPNSSRTLIDILRSTLSLAEYYGHMSGHDSTLHQLKTTLVQTIAELERLSARQDRRSDIRFCFNASATH